MPPESAAESTEAMSRDELGAASSAGGGATAGPSLPLPDDWAAHLAHKLDEIVSMIRDKTVRPVATAVRYLIFGLLALAVGTMLAVLFAIFSLRVLDTEVPVFRTRVWASYLVVAGIFWAAGLLLSRKRRSR